MTTYTYDDIDMLISDLHKDAYGFRPSEVFWAQDQAIESFEAKVVELMVHGAKDRLMAINWLLQSLDIDPTSLGRSYAYEELEWHLGLPYAYVAESLM